MLTLVQEGLILDQPDLGHVLQFVGHAVEGQDRGVDPAPGGKQGQQGQQGPLPTGPCHAHGRRLNSSPKTKPRRTNWPTTSPSNTLGRPNQPGLLPPIRLPSSSQDCSRGAV